MENISPFSALFSLSLSLGRRRRFLDIFDVSATRRDDVK